MKVLLVIRSAVIFHYYESIVASLRARGHEVATLFDRSWTDEKTIPVGLSYEWAVPSEYWGRRFLNASREILSYRRYLITKNQSSFYAERWLKYVSPKIRFFIKHIPGARWIIKTNFVGRLLRAIERHVSADSAIAKDINERALDAVVCTPVNFRQSSADLEYLKAAKILGISTVVPVISWDNLTTKGIFHVIPDLLLVWNKEQQEEAWVHHGIVKEQTAIIGAPFFDKWFTLLNAAPRQLRGAKLFNGTNSYIVYLGSSDNIAEDETWLIEKLRRALDEAPNPDLKKLHIIVRPHPAHFRIYEKIDTPGVSIIPKNGEMPKTTEALQDFYEMLFYSVAVVGINTSAMIDAMIAGKPVISMVEEKYKKTQMLAQHYQHLLESGAMDLAHSPEEFLQILTRLLRKDDTTKDVRKKFIEKFVRPLGIDKSAGDMAAFEIEKLVERKKHVEK